jgi:pilus assembly protein CpaE
LRNAKNIIELVKKARPDDILPRLVINQANTPKRPEIPSKDFAETMGIDPISVLPFDPALFGQAANNGQMIEEVSPKSKAAEAFQRLALSITRRDPPPAPKKSALAGLFKRK